MTRSDWWLLAMVMAVVLFAAPTPFWRVVMVLLVVQPSWHLGRSLWREWRAETADLRSLRRNEERRHGCATETVDE